jgi:hypothetical protein
MKKLFLAGVAALFLATGQRVLMSLLSLSKKVTKNHLLLLPQSA